MKSKTNDSGLMADRKNERGAALVTMLLVSILLLSAGLALVTSTSLSSTHTIDTTAEMQAYAGAEAGLQAALNVLRGNVAPDASISTTKMNFRSAANPATANKTSDPWATGGAATSRLSGWLNYSYQDDDDWRVPLTADYAPETGIAFKILILDPDDPGIITARKVRTDQYYQPSQLIIRSEGYGPKGAVKRLEMVIKRSAFDFDPPGVMTLPGGPGMAFDLGNSASSTFSGVDMGVPPQSSIPVVALAAGNVAGAQTVINGMHAASQVQPNAPGTLTADNTPSFLKTATDARAFLAEMRGLAEDSGRLFPTHADAVDSDGGMGTVTEPRFTFIDNYGGDPVDLGANHQGSGFLIVTGELDTHGNTDFEGIIMVLGRGKLDRDGGGEGVMRGAFVVCQFDPNGTDDVIGPPDLTISGGGTAKMAFDSDWVRRALDLAGFRVVGVREYHDTAIPGI